MDFDHKNRINELKLNRLRSDLDSWRSFSMGFGFYFGGFAMARAISVFNIGPWLSLIVLVICFGLIVFSEIKTFRTHRKIKEHFKVWGKEQEEHFNKVINETGGVHDS